MHDIDGAVLSIGDTVTIAAPRSLMHRGSHAEVDRFGSKRVYVKMIKASSEEHDGAVLPFYPDELRRGHHGTPRLGDRMQDIMLDFLSDVLQQAVDAGIVSAEQRARVVQMQRESMN